VHITGPPHRVSVAAWLMQAVIDDAEREYRRAAKRQTMSAHHRQKFRADFMFWCMKSIEKRLDAVGIARRNEEWAAKAAAMPERNEESVRRCDARLKRQQASPYNQNFQNAAVMAGEHAGKQIEVGTNVIGGEVQKRLTGEVTSHG
ncbi:MAG: hypothetical protein AAFN70_10415, partial [Planctomycetota bacterium]